MSRKLLGALQIAAVYVGTVVGAGFATGKEIVEFFTRFGFTGLLGILLSGYFFIYLGSKLMRTAIRIGAKSYQEFNEHLFGKAIGTIINGLMLVMLLGVCAVMLSGAGAVFSEQLGLSRHIGIGFTIVLVFIIMLIGIKGLFAVNVVIVPVMIGFSLMLVILSAAMPGFIDKLFYVPEVEDGWKAFAAPFSYTALNLGIAQAVLVPVAAAMKDDEMVKWGGIIGGVFLTAILLCSHFTLMMLEDVELYEIPMAVIMKKIAANFYWFYILVIYGEIFSSLVGDIYGLERQISKHISVPSFVIVSAIIAVSAFVGQIGYGKLLSILYPLFGYISLAFLFLLWIKPMEKRS